MIDFFRGFIIARHTSFFDKEGTKKNFFFQFSDSKELDYKKYLYFEIFDKTIYRQIILSSGIRDGVISTPLR